MVRALAVAMWVTLVASAASQDGFQPFDIRTVGVSQGGYIIAAPISRDSIGFIDMSGRVVFQRGVGLHTNLQTYRDNRASVFTGNFGYFVYVLFDSTLAPVDTMAVTSPYYTDSHEGLYWSDSTFMMLGLDYRSFDMSQIVTGGQSNASLMTTVIQERHIRTDSVLFEWNAFGRIPVTDATPDVELRQRTIDYIHANSIARDANGDLLVSCRHLDEVIMVRRSDGSIAWRLGGVESKNRQFRFIDDDHDGVQGFSHQHSAFITRTGTILLFDNGNLKPIKRSRVVEYVLDTVLMTATRMWSYTPDPPINSSSQGSVQELPNGNILVGYSSTDDTRIAEEVDRDGNVITQIRRTGSAPLQPYRVHHTTFGCTSVEKSLPMKGFVWFDTPDSTTGIALELGYAAQSPKARAELHHYRPHEWSTSDTNVCGPLSRRWTFAIDSSSSAMGGMRFDVSDFTLPNMLKLYHRPREGYGIFTPLETRYDATLDNGNMKTLILGSIMSGEFAIAYPWCIGPTPIYPRDGATNVPSNTRVRWSEATDALAYDLQVSLNQGFISPFLDVTTTRRDTLLENLQASTQFYWRVRKRTSTEVGGWSAPYTFTTSGIVGVVQQETQDALLIRIQKTVDEISVRSASDVNCSVHMYDVLGQCIMSTSLDRTQQDVRIARMDLPRIVVVVATTRSGQMQRTLLTRD